MRFSIITICWNNLPGLKSTYSSVKTQTLSDYEWIVVDGASDDGTVDFLNSLNEPKLTFVSEPDKGLYDAMNKGIKLAKGDYMVFMNSGDLFAAEDTLEEVSSVIDNNPGVIFIYGDALDFDMNENTYYRKSRSYKKIKRGMITQHQSMYFARLDSSKQIRYSLQYPYSADYDFIIRYFKLCKSPSEIVQIDKPLSRFQLGGLNETKRFEAIREDFLIRRRELQLNLAKNSFLLAAHYLHTHLKRWIPGLMKRVRYSSKDKGS